MLWWETQQTPQVAFGWARNGPMGERLLTVLGAGSASDARWLFYLNVLLGVFGLLGTWQVLDNAGPYVPQPFDSVGAGLLAVGFATQAST